jgi:hypothetical protein
MFDNEDKDDILALQAQAIEASINNPAVKRAQLLQVSTAIFCAAISNPNIGENVDIDKSIKHAMLLIDTVNQVDL